MKKNIVIRANDDTAHLIQATNGDTTYQGVAVGRGIAYDGGPLGQYWSDSPIYIELSSMTLRPQIPLLYNHVNSPMCRLGIVEAKVADNTIVVNAKIDANTEIGKAIADQGRRIPWQLSVGSSIGTVEKIDANQKTTVNGREVTGPAYICKGCELHEISVVAVGADFATQLNIQAGLAAPQPQPKGNTDMNPKLLAFIRARYGLGDAGEVAVMAHLSKIGSSVEAETAAMAAANQPPAPAPAPAPTTVQAAQPQPQAPAPAPAPQQTPAPQADPVQAALAAQQVRMTNVMTILAANPDLQRRAIAEGWDEARAATELNAANAANRPQASFVQTAPSSQAPLTNNVFLAAALQTAGTDERAIIATVGQQSLEMADHRFRGGLGLQQLVLEVAAANGHNPGTYRINGSNWYEIVSMARRPAIQGAFSNISLDGILGGVIQRRLLDGYGVVDQSCFDIAAVTPVGNFNQIESYRLKLGADGKAAFAKVPANGQLQHGTLAEDAFTNQADTYGMMLSITRKDYINDNLGAFTRIPFLLGQQAGMALNDVFWKEFMDNASFFTAAAGNLLTGAANALGVDGLSAALKQFRLLKDNGVLVGGRPAILLVGPSNEVTAGKLYTDSSIIATGVSSSRAIETSGNPHKGKYKPVVSPYLEDTTITGNSATAYYLLADPKFKASVEIVFLDGVRTPHIESAETEFSTLGTQFRCYYDFGVRKQDPLSGIKVTGANA